jgi:tetratricopeptide (TPR) repeat protein
MSSDERPPADRGVDPRAVDELTALVERDPGRALPAVERYRAAVGEEDDATIAAAAYLLGRALAETGDPGGARPHIEEAATRWAKAGDHLRALRTNAGLMSLLTHDGAHEAAIALGQRSLSLLAAGDTDAAVAELRGTLEQNVGVALAHGGRFTAALEAYARATTAYRAAGRPDRLPYLGVNRAAELLDLGQVADAVSILRTARADAEGLGLEPLVARCDGLLGWSAALTGELDRAADHLGGAIDTFRRLGLEEDAATATLRLGEVHLMLCAWERAEAAFGAVATSGGAVTAMTRASAHTGVVAAAVGRGDDRLAQQHLDAAITAWEELGHPSGLSGALVERAGLLLVQGRAGEAVTAALDALDVLGDEGARRSPIHRLYALLRLVDVLLPDAEAAGPYAEEAVELAERIRIPLLRCRAARRLGAVRAAAGDRAAALDLLDIAIETGEELRSRLPRESQRLTFGDDVDQALGLATTILLDRGDPASVQRAADLADRRRDRVLSELLDGQLLVETAGSAAAAVTAVSEALSVTDLPDRAAALRRHVDRLVSQHARSSPGYRSPAHVVLGDAATRTTATVLAYTVLDGEIAAFVTRGGRTRAVRRLGATGRLHDLLDELDGELWYAGLGSALSPDPEHPRVRATEQVLRALGELLLDPLDHLLPCRDPATTLAVVPHGVLHHVPFHALPSRRGPLLTTSVPVLVPNLRFLRTAPRAASPLRVVSLGVPSPSLPGIADELSVWGAAGLPSRVHTGADASIEVVRHARRNGNLLHIATHGVFDAEDPSRTRLRLADGWLTARELTRLDLGGMLVILSACDAARVGVREPTNATIGLARAALAAGADAVIASTWPLHDRVALELLSDLARQLASGAAPGHALRAAQLLQRARTPHPASWAAMTILGRPDPRSQHHAPNPLAVARS